MKFLRLLCSFALAAALGAVVQAQSAQAAQVSCTVTAANIDFGNVDVLTSGNVDVTGTVTVACSNGAPPNRTTRSCASIGVGSSGDTTSRRLVGPGGATLRYDLYSDAARTVKWGSWQTGYDTAGVTIDVPFNGSTQATVYARLFASQTTVVPGSYSSSFSANPFVTYLYDPGSTTCPSGSNTTSTSFTVTANVLTSCHVSTTKLDFGSVGFLTSNVDATSTVTTTCTSGTAYNIGLNAGNGTGATVATRKMTNGANTVNYSLYSNITRNTVWGNTVNTDTVSGTGSGLGQNFTVYGRIPPQTTPPPTTYTDTIVTTVTY